MRSVRREVTSDRSDVAKQALYASAPSIGIGEVTSDVSDKTSRCQNVPAVNESEWSEASGPAAARAEGSGCALCS